MKKVGFLFLVLLPMGMEGGRGPGAESKDKTTVPPHGIPARIPWTASRISGSPDPPHPYMVVRAFPNLSFKNPLLMVRAPGLDRFFVGEQAGQIYSFTKDQNSDKKDLFIDLTRELVSWDRNSDLRGVGAVYALVFHPQFQKNRYCYICYVLNSNKGGGYQVPDGTRVSRFKVTQTDPPRCDPHSEKVIITWLEGGHNGCDLHFGPDGFLYISTGDATSPNPPDALDTGQDLTDLLSSILRIDVDKEEKGRAYAIPPDNPFLKTPGARPEIWSYGFRNPWRMSFDRVTGDLWVGDVGWELWEMVYRIQRGGNYGWPVMEGRQPVKPNGKRGPTPILPPTLEFPHTEAASITGGYVYRGKRFPELFGAYICGDWVTRKLWATKFDGDKILWHKEIAQGNVRVVSFVEDVDGEQFFVHHDENGTIHQLVPNEKAKEKQEPFPHKLSETGLFSIVAKHVPSPGVVPFSINAEQWMDHATAERFLALPGTSTAKVYDVPVPSEGFFRAQVFFPRDGVLAKTISMEMERGNPLSRQRLETQILHFDGITWRGYSYRWNDAQTDADLVPAAGADQSLTIKDAQAPGGTRRQTWHFPSRTECLLCHNPWPGFTLAFNRAQLHKDHLYHGVKDNQLRALEHVGLIKMFYMEPSTKIFPKRLTPPHDAKANINDRARSYLHVNCAHCHQFGAGGTADLELRFGPSLEKMKIMDVRPVQGTFDIPEAKIVAPGDPYRSVLYYRMARLGGGRMPHIGSSYVDEKGLELIRDWIRQLPMRKEERILLAKLKALDEEEALAREKAEAPGRIERIARSLAKGQGRKEPNEKDRQAAKIQDQEELARRGKQRAGERGQIIASILANTDSAQALAQALASGDLSDSMRAQVLTAAVLSPSQVRGLFERFIPDELRVQRLGTSLNPEPILTLKGDPEKGRQFFFNAAVLQCSTCHRIAGKGTSLGPDLDGIGKKYSRALILENILQPSKVIEPKYVTYQVEGADGRIHTGLLAEKNDKEIILNMAGAKEMRIPARDVVRLSPQKTSLMPELLLRDLTPQEAADLLDFLASLK